VLVVEERHNRPIRQVDRDQLTETDRVEPGRLYTHTHYYLTNRERRLYEVCVCVHSNLVPHLFSTTTTTYSSTLFPPPFAQRADKEEENGFVSLQVKTIGPVVFSYTVRRGLALLYAVRV
jgi:hypothetical protein